MEVLVFIGVLLFLGWLANLGSSNGSSNMGSFRIRLQKTQLGENKDGPFAIEVEGKGLLPVSSRTRIGFLVSVFDKTDGEWEPVFSSIEQFQESQSSAYQCLNEGPNIDYNQGYVDWVPLGVVIPEIISPPYGGNRVLIILLRIVDWENIPEISYGFSVTENHTGLVWSNHKEYQYNFEEKGWKEEAEGRDEVRALAIKLAVSVALSDGTIDESEGYIIKDWITDIIDRFSGEVRNEMKELYNNSLKEAYSQAKSGELAISEIIDRMNEIDITTHKYEAIQLCFDVMAADGQADKSELELINNIANQLDLDLTQIENLRDEKLIGLTTSVGEKTGVEEILGIDEEWENDEVLKHLTKEFNKWNSRLNSLEEGEERNKAQEMINEIAKARKKYA